MFLQDAITENEDLLDSTLSFLKDLVMGKIPNRLKDIGKNPGLCF